jgi:hypothetical protein
MDSYNTEYGNRGVVKPLSFTGVDKSEYPMFRNFMNSKFSANGIDVVDKNDPLWMTVSQLLYAQIADERKKWTLAEINDPTEAERVRHFNIKVGDYHLSGKSFKEWKIECDKHLTKKNMASAFILDAIPESSAARLVILQASPDLKDARAMILALDEAYMANRLSNLVPYIVKVVDIYNSTSLADTALLKMNKLDKLRSDFHAITSKALALTGESDKEREVRVFQKSSLLFDFLTKLVTVLKHSANSLLVNEFINRFVKDDLGCPINDLNLSTLRNSFIQFMNLNVEVSPTFPKTTKTLLNSVDKVNSTDKVYSATHVTQLHNQINNLKKFKENLTTKSKASSTVSANSNTGSKKARFEKTVHPIHEFCMRQHAVGQCYWDPTSAAYNTDRAVSWRDKFPGQKPGNASHITETNVVIVTHLPIAEVDLADLNEGESPFKSNIVLLDGGSDSLIFNSYHLHLFTRLEPFACPMSGISGPIPNTVTHSGVVEFMGVSMNAYYSSDISKSVVSEGILTLKYGFSINKYGNICIITYLKTGLSSTTLQVDSTYPLPITLFTHDIECHAINLASVRPSNPKTLWHSRFGHAYMGLIVRMAKMPLYRERGLKIPKSILDMKHDEDLCDECALSKPTFSNAFDFKLRSEIKGQLWYVDVSGGGHLTPSVKYGNKYIYLFVDSCTRMYFKYFSKRVDDKTTLKILDLFYNEVLSYLPHTDEFRFIQSDNGQLDTNQVKGWIRRNKIYSEFPHAAKVATKFFIVSRF